MPELTAHLDDNLLWRYRVRARDDEGAVSPWSEVDSVLVNFAEDPPSTLLPPGTTAIKATARSTY